MVMVHLEGDENPTVFTTSSPGWLAAPSYYTVANAWASAIDWTAVQPGWSTPSFTPSVSWKPVQQLDGLLLPARALQVCLEPCICLLFCFGDVVDDDVFEVFVVLCIEIASLILVLSIHGMLRMLFRSKLSCACYPLI